MGELQPKSTNIGSGKLLIFNPGQVYKFSALEVKAQTGKDIGDRWFAVAQSKKLSGRDRVILVLLSGLENKKKNYPWLVDVKKAEAEFLDKDSMVLCHEIFVFPKTMFEKAAYMGQFSEEICKRICVGLIESLLTSDF